MRFIALILVLLSIPSGIFAKAAEKKAIRDYMTVSIACPNEAPPYFFSGEDGEPQGLIVDLWHLWARKTGIRVNFVPGTWRETFIMMKQGRTDIHAGLFYNEARGTWLLYGPPLTWCQGNFFVHKSISGLKKTDDLAGFRIGVIKDSYGEYYLQQYMENPALSVCFTAREMAEKLEKKEIRVFLAPVETSRYLLKKYNLEDEFYYDAKNPLYVEAFYPAVKKENTELADIIRQGIALISADERAQIERKWLGTSTINTEDTLVIAIPRNLPPLGFVNDKGQPAGIFVDIWKLWSEKTGRRIDFLPSVWSDTLKNLETGKADIHAGLFYSPERAEWISYSQPFYETGVSVFFLSGDQDISNIRALSGKKVGTVAGSYQESWVREHYPELDIVLFDATEDMIHTALDGRIAAFVADTPTTSVMLATTGHAGDFRPRSELLFTRKFHAGVLKNEKLLSQMDQGLNAISNRELAEIESRWIADPDIRSFGSGASEIRFTSEEKAWIRKHPVIRFGTPDDLAPLSFIRDDGIATGMVEDYLKLLGKRSGLDLKIGPVEPWTSLRTGFMNKMIDGVACIMPTALRTAYIDFTEPYISLPLSIITRNDFPYIPDIEHLRTHRVVTLRANAIQDILQQYPDVRVETVDTPEQVWQAVAAGKADACIANIATAGYYITRLRLTNLKVASLMPDKAAFSLGIRKDWPELVSILNKAIATITPAEHEVFLRKWMAVRYEPRIVWQIILPWILATCLVMGVTLVWNRRLRREIRDRKQAENSFLESESRYKNLFHNNHTIMLLIDPENGDIRDANPAAA